MDEVISVADAELTIEKRIDGGSHFWAEAPYLLEAPLVCPLPSDIATLPAAYEAFVLLNDGNATELVLSLEGDSVDAELTAEPLLFVYQGDSIPDNRQDALDCLGLANPGGGMAGTVTAPVGPGDLITVLAVENEIGPGLDGNGSGTFRLRITPQ